MPRQRSGLGDAAASEFVAAAKRTLAVAVQQYGQLVNASGVATPQNVGNMTTQAPYQVADAYNAAMAYALSSFAASTGAAGLAQSAIGYIASINPLARTLQSQASSVASTLAPAASSAIGCASQSVIDPATGVCCNPDSCSWDTVNWVVRSSFIAQTQRVSALAAQLVFIAQQALALPPLPVPTSPVHLLPIRAASPTSSIKSALPAFSPLRGVGRPRRVGLGDLSFDEWMQDPNFASQWNQLKAQVQAEGGTNLVVAQNSMLSAANQLASVSEITVNPNSSQIIASAAGSFATLGNTVLGAVGSISGLIQEAQQPGGAHGLMVVQGFTGILIGLATTAGAVSAGVGAAIVAGLGLIASLVGNLFNGPPPVATIGECQLNYQPTLMVADSLLWSKNGQPVTAGPSTAAWSKWRRFPNATKSSDAPWFQPGSIAGFNWLGDDWGACVFSPLQVTTTVRPIDVLFENGSPVYAQLEADNFLVWAVIMAGGNAEIYTALVGLYNAFLAAWKSNREYGLNGLQRQSDAQVLAQVVSFWNAAHQAGQGFNMSAAPFQPYSIASQGAPPPPSTTPYMAMLIGNIQSGVSSIVAGQIISSSGALHINTGALKNVPNLAGTGVSVTPTASGMSTGSKVLVGVGVAVGLAAAAEGYYAWHNKISYGKALKGTWDASGGRAVRFVRRHV
jgi:hypothetical protein